MRLLEKIAVLASSILLLCSSGVSYAQNTSRQESRKAKLEKEIADLDRQIRETSSKSSSVATKLTLTRQKITARKALISESDREIAVLSDSLAAKQRGINILTARLDTLTTHYKLLLISAYKHRDARTWYMYVLSSENIAQGMRRYAYFKNLSSELDTQVVRIKSVREQLKAEQAALGEMKSRAQVLRTSRVKEMNSLKSDEADAQSQMKALNRDKARYQKELAVKRRQVEALDREIARIIAQAMKGGSTEKGTKGRKTKPSAPIDYKLGGAFQANKGKLPWPADGPVVEHFGKQFHPVFKNLLLPDSQGITISTAPGAKAKAVYDGTVRSIVVMPGYNQCVLVQHGNYFTFYCKLSKVSVKNGQKLKTGDVIGTVDTMSGETCLHFQVWEGVKRQNPEIWLRPR